MLIMNMMQSSNIYKLFAAMVLLSFWVFPLFMYKKLQHDQLGSCIFDITSAHCEEKENKIKKANLSLLLFQSYLGKQNAVTGFWLLPGK